MKAARFLLPLAVVGLVMGACGDGGNGGEDGDQVTVTAQDLAFDPQTVSLETGQQVEIALENEDSTAHTLTAEDLDLNIEADGGQTGSATITAPDEDGTFGFVCTIHPSMTGEIVIGGGDTGGRGGDDGEDTTYDNATPGESPPEGTTEGEDEYDDGG